MGIRGTYLARGDELQLGVDLETARQEFLDFPGLSRDDPKYLEAERLYAELSRAAVSAGVIEAEDLSLGNGQDTSVWRALTR